MYNLLTKFNKKKKRKKKDEFEHYIYAEMFKCFLINID